jgi:uncharacterized membrane protein YhiD involved in acid resistance
MACGARFYGLAIFSTILALVVLVGLWQVDKYIGVGRDNGRKKEINNQ